MRLFCKVPKYRQFYWYSSVVAVVKSHNCVQLLVTPWTAAHQASLSFTSPRVSSNSCPLSWWYHPITSSFAIPFSSCLQAFPASGSFLIHHFFASDGQSFGTSASASVFPMNVQGWFPLGLTGFIPLLSKGLGTSPAPQFEGINSSSLSLFHCPALTSIPDYWKKHSFD